MNKVVNLLGTGEKQGRCEFSPYNFSSRNKRNKQTNKQANKNHSNSLTLTVLYQKKNCLIRCKKKKQEKAKQYKNKERTTERMT